MPVARKKRRSLESTASVVLAALQQDQRPYSAYELIDRLQGTGITAPPTVYRALEQLIASGRVHRLESLNAYVACSRGHCREKSDAVFAICDDCGSVDELADTSVLVAAADWAKKNAFALREVAFELRGRCVSCHVGDNRHVEGG